MPVNDPLDQPEPDSDLGLAVPFTVCASEGGPHDDDAFVAGFDCGAMHTEMRIMSAVGGAPAARWVKPGILDQLDLLAMDSRYTIKRGETDEATGWVRVSFTAPTCEHQRPTGED